MAELSLRLEEASKAVATLAEIVEMEFSIIIRDATIQRFEYSFEATWKALREHLKEREGILCNSPKSCFREALRLGLLTEEETARCLEMTDRRNDTTHTYREEIAQAIYREIPSFLGLLQILIAGMEERAD
ncbi:MAG: HI0074 family nucleotidyltransferase substrate-binding subunit [Coprothermobacterota bacterium]|jgi:nucleotidyltransferase substrate binding protein (TIGR01987 family)|nr:HI0074 family nucleotidyltransferase substrate-binding subunit [Coprothermobacterota bacterium]